jgi:hypothetical protein
MTQLRGIAGLAEETVLVVVGGKVSQPQDLERYNPVKLGVAGLEDSSEPTCADRRYQLEPTRIATTPPGTRWRGSPGIEPEGRAA